MFLPFGWRSSMVEQWFCKPQVVGSIPTASSVGSVPEWLWGRAVNPLRNAQWGFDSLPAHQETKIVHPGQATREVVCVGHGSLIRRARPSSRLSSAESGRSSVVELRPSKPSTRVRFPSPAPSGCCSSVVERLLGKEEVTGSTPVSSSVSRRCLRVEFSELSKLQEVLRNG